jgi:phospholipase/carboxylesterase
MTWTLDLPIERLPQQGQPEQLIILLHGWASDAAAMAPLAQALRQQFPQAALLAPEAPHPADAPRPGRQWYSIADLFNPAEPDIWPQRVMHTVGLLLPWVQAQQRRLRVAPAATALAGFSQGAILSLALAMQQDGLVGRVLSFGGTFVTPPEQAPRHTTFHFFHGAADRVISPDGSRQGFERLGELQGDATIDIAEGIGHELHPVLMDCALHRLRSHIPLRTWQAALGAVPTGNALRSDTGV